MTGITAPRRQAMCRGGVCSNRTAAQEPGNNGARQLPARHAAGKTGLAHGHTFSQLLHLAHGGHVSGL